MSPKRAQIRPASPPARTSRHPIATPAPAAGISENSVTMLGVIRRAAMNDDHRVEHPVDHLHRRLVDEHAAAVGLGARVADAADAAAARSK